MALIKGWRAGRGLQRAKGRHRCGGGGGRRKDRRYLAAQLPAAGITHAPVHHN